MVSYLPIAYSLIIQSIFLHVSLEFLYHFIPIRGIIGNQRNCVYFAYLLCTYNFCFPDFYVSLTNISLNVLFDWAIPWQKLGGPFVYTTSD